MAGPKFALSRMARTSALHCTDVRCGMGGGVPWHGRCGGCTLRASPPSGAVCAGSATMSRASRRQISWRRRELLRRCPRRIEVRPSARSWTVRLSPSRWRSIGLARTSARGAAERSKRGGMGSGCARPQIRQTHGLAAVERPGKAELVGTCPRDCVGEFACRRCGVIAAAVLGFESLQRACALSALTPRVDESRREAAVCVATFSSCQGGIV